MTFENADRNPCVKSAKARIITG